MRRINGTRRFARSGVLAIAALVLAICALVVAPAGAGVSAPVFVQQAAGHGAAVTSLAVTPGSSVASGNRLVVVAGVWSSAGATTAHVSDSAGNTYVELLHFKASDGTEMSVWTAPITSGGGTKPTVTVTPSAKADVGVAVSEYSGLSSVGDASVVDQLADSTGTTSSAATVSSGPTAATASGNELALGMYVDSGFGDSLTAGSGWTQRSSVSKTSDMEVLTEDQALASAGATPNASVGTGAHTIWLMATVVLKAASSGPATAPAAPTGASATAGNASATVSWNAPSNGGSLITSYTVTPYAGSTALTPTTVTGTPPTTNATISGLTNGTSYTFTVTATNAIGTGPPSSPSNAVTPSNNPAPVFVQQAAGHGAAVTSLAVTPGSSVASGNRLVVVAGVWSSAGATTAHVSDSAGNTYVELLHFKASDGTEMSVWTAPITSGGGTKPTVTVTPSAKADVGVAVSEYSGLSSVGDASVVDQLADSTGTTSSAATVSSGPTAATASGNELALGMYVDSGFGDSLTAGSGWTQRSSVSKTSDMEVLTEDQALASAGATPNASVGTGAHTIWLMATVVLKAASSGPATAPAAPTGASATAGNASATVSWNAPSNGGSLITSYTVTPYAGSTALTPTTVTGTPPTTNATISGLTNGTSYTFTVTATNAIGTGPPSSPSNAVTPQTATGGQWSALMSWPMVAIHSILLDTGNVLQFDGWQQPEPTQVWNPGTGTFTTQTAPDSIFCSGMAELPDGRVLVIGGYGGLTTGKAGIDDTNIFDPTTSTWTRVANMHDLRWYPDLTELADGRYVAISGNSDNSGTWSDTPEVYNPQSDTWTLLSNVDTSQVHEEEYPFSYLVPNGDVFTIGPSEDKSFLLNVGNQTWTPVGGSSGVVNGSSVMYRPGQILYSGGTNSQASSSPANATTAVINLNDQTPQWQQTAPMNYARVYHTLTMLADGTVLAVGGETSWGQTGQSEISGGVLPSEIWNPTTQTWSLAASTGTTRGYHSTAILMPDGTVLVGGSGHANPGYPGQDSAQIYSPPYLFKGPRPTITSAPASAQYGATIPVSTPDAGSISAVNLVSLGSDTHQSDMDQHFVPLQFTQGTGGLNVQIPSSAATAPPGNYMLFILNSNGVPSVASFINLGATAPAAPSGVAATAGNGSATVTWTAPYDNGSPVSGYTVTPYIGTTAQTPTTVSGSPAPTGATITGLTNGASYTFTVTATNAAGSGAASSPSNAVTPTASPAPAFVQGTGAHGTAVSSLTVTPAAVLSSGNRLIVEAGVWNAKSATTQSVTDSAGDQFTELLHFKASDGTEMSVWSASITAGGGTRPTVTVTPSSAADAGVALLEYSGLSTVADASVVDQAADAVGNTTTAATVSSGSTPATTAGNELALGLYADSGFGDTLTPASGYTQRVNVSNTSDMELLAEDQVLPSAGATPNASTGTGARTTWLMATVVLKSGGTTMGADRALKSALSPSAPQSQGVRSTLGRKHDSRQRHARAAKRGHQHPGRRCSDSRTRRGATCRSVRRAAAITAADRARFVRQALLKHLSSSLFCFHGKALQLGFSWTGAWFRPPRSAQSSS